jgi:hypothetical protein
MPPATPWAMLKVKGMSESVTNAGMASVASFQSMRPACPIIRLPTRMITGAVIG